MIQKRVALAITWLVVALFVTVWLKPDTTYVASATTYVASPIASNVTSNVTSYPAHVSYPADVVSGFSRTLSAQALSAQAASPDPAFLKQYCITCHNQQLKTAGLALDTLDVSRVGADAETWEKAARKLRTGMMPPAGARRPERAVLDAFASQLEASLDRAAVAGASLATPALHRLNRNEYANAIRDLLALEVDVTALLPADGSSEGFDNIAEALSVSPSLIQGYVSAAMKISRQAVGDMFLALGRLGVSSTDDSLRRFRIPGGRLGIWVTASSGFLATALSMALLLVPPPGTPNVFKYEANLILQSAILLGIGLVFFLRAKGRRAPLTS